MYAMLTPQLVLLILLSFQSQFIFAEEYAVIVHPDNTSEFDQGTIERLFLAKQKTFPSGEQAVPIEIKRPSKERETFNKKVIGKSDIQIRTYWAMLIFSGKGKPPKQVDTQEQVIELVSHNRNMVGYVASDHINNEVRVIFTY